MKNFPIQLWETGEENQIRESINEKLLKLDEEIREENQNMCREKRDFGQNKVLFSSW